jgi:hypothetical protein
MITFTILFTIAYIYIIYKIKKTCGSWKKFNTFDATFIEYFIFMLGTTICISAIIYIYIYFSMKGIIP